MSFHHRVTQSITEFYFFDFKLIKLCETLCYSVVSPPHHLNIGTANHFLNIFVTNTYNTKAETNPAIASIR